MNNNEPFIRGYGSKPWGNFYPLDMSKEEFEAFDSDTSSLYTVIGRKDDGTLESVPYSQAYNEQHEKAAELLLKAAELAEDEGLKNYLAARSQALLTDDYLASDLAWMDMKTNNIDFVIGPIENYEDRLFGYKAAHEAFILIKDLEWSSKLSRFAASYPNYRTVCRLAPSIKKRYQEAIAILVYMTLFSMQAIAMQGAKPSPLTYPTMPGYTWKRAAVSYS